MFRSLRIVFAAALFAVPFVMASAAIAQTCAPVDVACTPDQILDQGQDAAGDAAGTAGDAANAAHDAADDTVSRVKDTVDDTLHGGGIDPPPIVGGGDGGNGGHDGDGHTASTRDRRPGANGSGRTEVRTSGSRHGEVGASAGTSAGVPLGTVEPTAPTTDPAARSDADTAPPTIGQVAAGVLTGVAVMALLLGGVAAFLAVQDRLDRRDPKLAPAAIGSDRVLFS
jgi:hypothetical protein